MAGVFRMDKFNGCKSRCHSAGKSPPHGRGPSSYWIHDPVIIFKELNLQPGEVFLDIGCGTGDYSIHAAKEVGEEGLVYATDVRKDLLDNLMERAKADGLNNIRGIAGDIHDPLPFNDTSIDVCFISTVLHCVDLQKAGNVIFPEIRRILKPEGRLVIIECKKEEMPFGPPLHMRISPDELEGHISAFDFLRANLVDLGYNYMITFTVNKVTS